MSKATEWSCFWSPFSFSLPIPSTSLTYSRALCRLFARVFLYWGEHLINLLRIWRTLGTKQIPINEWEIRWPKSLINISIASVSVASPSFQTGPAAAHTHLTHARARTCTRRRIPWRVVSGTYGFLAKLVQTVNDMIPIAGLRHTASVLGKGDIDFALCRGGLVSALRALATRNGYGEKKPMLCASVRWTYRAV